MFRGLVATSLTTALMGAAIFQRKSRAGWLDELDGIRHDALAVPGGEVAVAMAASALPGGSGNEWPEPEELGADDQYGIASLYAEDEPTEEPPAGRGGRNRGDRGRRSPHRAAEAPTPPPVTGRFADLPAPPAPAEAAPPAVPAGGIFADLPAPPPPPTVTAFPGLPAPPVVASSGPAPDPAPVPDPVPAAVASAPDPASVPAPAAQPAISPEDRAEDEARLAAEQERVANWAQPAPHPIRPNELWHAAVPPEPVADELPPLAPEERVASAELLGTEDRRRIPTFRPVAVDAISGASAEDALHGRSTSATPAASAPTPAPAPMVPIVPAASATGLINGPVARRVRRDRPTERIRLPLPAAPGEHQPLPDRSPLPEAALPPAALPATPAPVPAAAAGPVADLVAPTIPVPVDPARAAAAPVAPAPTVAPAPVVAVAPAAVVAVEVAPVDLPLPVPDAAHVPAPVTPAAVPQATSIPDAVPTEALPPVGPLALDAEGTVVVGGTVLRLGGARLASAAIGADGPEIELAEGWAWVAPAATDGVAARVVLPGGVLLVDRAATVLAVVEADGSTFVLVASGEARLARGDDEAPLRPGTMVMLPPDGPPQIDVAAPAEIEGDPIVAANRALDGAR